MLKRRNDYSISSTLLIHFQHQFLEQSSDTDLTVPNTTSQWSYSLCLSKTQIEDFYLHHYPDTLQPLFYSPVKLMQTIYQRGVPKWPRVTAHYHTNHILMPNILRLAGRCGFVYTSVEFLHLFEKNSSLQEAVFHMRLWEYVVCRYPLGLLLIYLSISE